MNTSALICSTALLLLLVVSLAGCAETLAPTRDGKTGSVCDSFPLTIYTICTTSPAADRITGGISTVRHQHPHLCAMQLIRRIGPSQYIGAASILARRWLLTAASVLLADNINRRTELHCGRFDLGRSTEPTEQRMRIGRVHPHPRYAGTERQPVSAYDVALLHLAAELHFTAAVQPIALPAAGDDGPGGIATLLGWAGSDEGLIGQRLQWLQVARVPIYAGDQCTDYLARMWPALRSKHTQFCTGPQTGGVTPCNEDRGSSLVQQVAVGQPWVLVGVVSLPQACGEPGALGTYTRVAQMVTWIGEVIV